MQVLLLCLALAEIGAIAPAHGETAGYSAAALYNLGNANARAGKHGAAVLNYERARLLAPGDPDILANLQIVRNAAHLPAAPQRWFEHPALAVSPTLTAWLGLVGVLLLGGSLVWGGRPPAPRWLRPLTAPLGALLVGLTLINAWLLWPLLHEAVVLTPATAVRVTPVPMGDPAFMLAEAETVTISAQHDDFYLIRSTIGKTGWVARGNVGLVVPRP